MTTEAITARVYNKLNVAFRFVPYTSLTGEDLRLACENKSSNEFDAPEAGAWKDDSIL